MTGVWTTCTAVEGSAERLRVRSNRKSGTCFDSRRTMPSSEWELWRQAIHPADHSISHLSFVCGSQNKWSHKTSKQTMQKTDNFFICCSTRLEEMSSVGHVGLSAGADPGFWWRGLDPLPVGISGPGGVGAERDCKICLGLPASKAVLEFPFQKGSGRGWWWEIWMWNVICKVDFDRCCVLLILCAGKNAEHRERNRDPYQCRSIAAVLHKMGWDFVKFCPSLSGVWVTPKGRSVSKLKKEQRKVAENYDSCPLKFRHIEKKKKRKKKKKLN